MIIIACTYAYMVPKYPKAGGEFTFTKGELVGIHKLSNAFYKEMCDDYALKADDKPKLGYEYQLLTMSQEKMKVYVLCIDGLKWYEIDDADDLAYAEEHILRYL